MPSDLTLTFNRQEVERQFKDLEKSTSRNLAHTLRDYARKFLEMVIILTPPTLRGSITENLSDQRRKSENRIDNEISALFFPIRRIAIATPKKRGVWVKLFTTPNFIWLTPRNLYRPDATSYTLHTFHKRQYDSRGRFKRPRRPILTKVGANVRGKPVKIVRKMVVMEETLDAYRKEVKSHLGRAKSGWKPAAQKLQVSLPGWISRHNAPGDIIDRSNRSVDPEITMTNKVPYVQDTIGRAMKQTADALEKNLIEEIIKAIMNAADDLRRKYKVYG